MKRDRRNPPLKAVMRDAKCRIPEGKHPYSTSRIPHSAHNTGFTLLEVIVALAIVGISLGVYMSLIGTSFKLKGKIDDHARKALVAVQKAEEAHLGLLGKKYTSGKDTGRKVWEGVTEDGIAWKVRENAKRDFDERNKPVAGVVFYDVTVGGVNINSIRNNLQTSPDDESEESEKNKSE